MNDRRRSAVGGFSAIEALAAIAVIAIGVLVSVPVIQGTGATLRVRASARQMALTLQAMRWKSVATHRAHGLWFADGPGGWSWREVQDGNGNGLRVAELRSGVDLVLTDPLQIDAPHGNVRFGFPSPGPYPRVPPARGSVDGRGDPIRFGRSDVISFSPLGSASSGTMYLTDGKRELFAVVLFGPSSKIRVWRFDASVRAWKR